MCVAAVLLVLALPATGSLAAQTVRGQLIDSISRAPLPGAFVTLVDEHGAERVRAMTNAAGEFILTAPAGPYKIRSKRIGFRPYLSPALTLRSGETISFIAAVDPIPLALSKVVVEGDRQCNVASGAGGGASVAAVWDEVREALAAVSWTSRDPGYWYAITRFTRETTPQGRARGPDSTWRDDGYRRIPIQSAPPEQLEREGFVVVDEAGWTYHGPDADALISDPFLRTHCFETKTGHGETEGLIGLAFTPARGRTLPDISGTLWIDRQSALLHHLDFTYTRLPQEVVAQRAGGRIEFLRVPSGAWIVRDWVIRMPLAAMKERLMAMGSHPEVVGFRETGGSALEIKTRTGTILYGAEPAAPAPAVAVAPPAQPPAPIPAVEPTSATDTTASSPAPPATGTTAPPIRKSHNANLIDRSEIESSTAIDAYALVQESRPTWLHTRGTISIRDPSAGVPQVYLNGTRLGDVNQLREIQLSEVRELRFFGAAEAQMRYGTGHAGGVIEVSTGAVAPTGPISSAPPAPSPPTSDSTPPRSSSRASLRNSNVLKAEEFEKSTAIDVYALVQEFRPTWLHSRGVTSIRDQSAGQLRVYLNGVSAGDVNQLREIRVSDVRELRFLGAAEAQARYGLGHGGGVIEVLTR
jgi:hypothetical protein